MFATTYEARWARTMAAVEMRPVDKIPFSYNGPAYLAKDRGLTISEYCHDFPKATQATIDFCNLHPCVDSLHTPAMSPHCLSTLWLSAARCPGEDLGDDELWQIEEKEILTFEDYEAIIKEGYGPWVMRVMSERLGDPLSKMMPFLQYSPTNLQRVATEAQMPVLNYNTCGSPFEALCGGRTLMQFFMDIVEEPELVKAALDKAMEFERERHAGMLASTKPLSIWVGGWRAAPELMSHDMWREFAWPYIKEMVEITLAHGVLPVLHFDSCWERELDALKELPARKCILMLDGTTDIRKAREVLGDHMCLLGDVPAHLLSFGTADEVYNYVAKMIEDVGPKTGLIVSSGCDTPLNARPENVEAMFQATLDHQV